ncbi:MAG TPA: hypothetical protein VK824_06035, partial [Planctomycetota bacterium]|nr:hypothetical protein [Planctomycetota bacterium]
GLAAGFALAPWSADVLLGATRTLQVTALIGASAALLFLERTPRPLRDARLPAGGGAAALALGVALLVAERLFSQQLDRGPLLGPALATLVCLGALPGLFLRRTPALPLLIATVAAGLPMLFPADTWIAREIVRDTGSELLTLALVALPAGLALGALAAQSTVRTRTAAAGAAAGAHAAQVAGAPEVPARGVPLAWLPALLLAAAPVTTLALLPRLDARVVPVLFAALVAAVMARRLRGQLVATGALVLVAGLSLAGVGASPPPGAQRAEAVAHGSDGDAALVSDPATGRRLLAIDGHAPFGRSAAQERRFALLPLLLWGPSRRVLVIASGFGETASAAWSTGLAKLHWLQPFTHPEGWDEVHWPGEDPPTTGSERQFLAVPREPYDLIIMAPDARVSARGGLLGTEEFYRLAASRLQPDGLLCQWWDLAGTDISDLKSIIASAAAVFPSCSLLMDHPRTRRACVGLLLSAVPLRVRPAEVDSVLAGHAEVAADMAAIGLDGLGLACLVTADRGIAELMAPAESALHDDRPVLGVRGALRAQDSRTRLLEGLAALTLKRRDPMPWIVVPPESRGDMTLLVRDRYRGWQHLFGGAQRVVAALGPSVAPFDREAPGTGPEVEASSFQQALASLPDDHGLVELLLGHATWLEQQGRQADAEVWLRQAIATDSRDAALHFALGALQERRGLLDDAAVHYTSVLTLNPGHPAALEALAGLQARGVQPVR